MRTSGQQRKTWVAIAAPAAPSPAALHTHAHTHTQTHTHTHTHIYTHDSLTHRHTHVAHSLTHSLTYSLTHTHTHTLIASLCSNLSEERNRCSEAGLSQNRAIGALPVLGFSWQEMYSTGRVPDCESTPFSLSEP